MQIRTDDNGLTHDVLTLGAERLRPYVEKVTLLTQDFSYPAHESFLALPFDEAQLARAEAVAEKLRGSLRYVILVGIGASDLGTRAIYEALTGAAHPLGGASPQLIVCNTVEPGRLSATLNIIASSESAAHIALVVVSKSGSTVETRANAGVLYDALVARWGREAAQRVVAISIEGSAFYEEAQRAGMHVVPVPERLGGRYSVMSAVGLVPLLLLNIDVRALLDGGRAGANASVAPGARNPAVQMAVALAAHYTLGKYEHDFFVFNPELKRFGDWYRQLLAESIGKTNRAGEQVGVTPSVLVGSTDLHSMGQLVFGGPNNRQTTFVSIPEAWDAGPMLSTNPLFTVTTTPQRAGTVMHAISSGTQAAYRKAGLPFTVCELHNGSARDLGALMSILMASVMYTAELLEVNAFDQPAVESYKTETRRFLSESTPHQQ